MNMPAPSAKSSAPTDFASFLRSLQCPFCSGSFTFKEVPAKRGRNGVLSCGCSKFPVLEDVPIMMKGAVGIISHWNDGAIHLGPTGPQLVEMIERGQADEALIECLLFPRFFPFQYRLTHAGLWPTTLGRTAGLALTRRTLKSILSRPASDTVADDLFQFFYSRRSGNNPYLAEYFRNRFVMPRYLSAMTLVQRLPSSTKPVLDIACGYGQFEHFMTQRINRMPAVGIDLNFFQAWGAKHWVAPQAQFACCDASLPLPFKDGTFSAAMCSDAFMLIPDKPLLLAQIERVAPGMPWIFARCGNVDVGPPNPRHGGEMTPDDYWRFFGTERTRYVADSNTWKDYLMRRHPFDRSPVPMPDLRWEKYITYVVNPDGLTGEPDPGGRLPHGVGKLALNPVISIAHEDAKTIETEFMYKTTWGGYEDSDMISYTERWGEIDRQQLRRALAEPDGDDARRLIERFVLIGVPKQYLHDDSARLAA